MKRVCVFCGSSAGTDPIYAEQGRALGHVLVRHQLGLVYGGGNIGLMGVIADAVLEAGGEVVGVIPQALVDKELAHHGVTKLHVVGSMHKRKAMMADMSDAFIALPGGFGTLDEFCEILTWAQLGLHAKPCGLLNVQGFYDPFLAQLDAAVSAGFLRASHRQLITVETSPEKLLSRLLAAHPAPEHKWIDRDQS